MEKLDKFVGPGTAGIAQRIPSGEYGIEKSDLYVVKFNRPIECSQNQY
ncbi:MAG: hypothetical protein Q7R52_00070 [archaeon]|nr:hypothetical protein [archaeon]